jgi:hypothetical protein
VADSVALSALPATGTGGPSGFTVQLNDSGNAPQRQRGAGIRRLHRPGPDQLYRGRPDCGGGAGPAVRRPVLCRYYKSNCVPRDGGHGSGAVAGNL